jgi:hypothetical protein
MAPSALAFAPGDVIQTEPQPGYWGCAIVLTATDRTAELLASFHIGITPLIFRHDYAWPEVDPGSLSILELSRDIRLARGEYGARTEVCIGIYTARSRGSLRVIGKVDPGAIYPLPLTSTVGDGTAGAFPLCGPLKKTIGSEAVVAWRRVHDAENFARDVAVARARFEELEAERLARQRQARRGRREDA